MPNIAIISASVRNGRNSHRVALFFEKFLTEKQLATPVLLDLLKYDFPVFHERLKYLPNPGEAVMEFVDNVRKADGVIIVTPEYNGGYPAALKNIIDLLYEDWYRKPIAVATVSDGSFGGTQVITSLLFTLWKIKAWVVPPAFNVPKVQDMFDESGSANDEMATHKRAEAFVKELLWSISISKQ